MTQTLSMEKMIENMTGWQEHGVAIEAPEGYNVYDYFRDGVFIGPDKYGVEPIFTGVAPHYSK